VLIGLRSDGLVTIARAAETANRAAAADSFECDPGAVVALAAGARGEGLDIVGFWHSHASGDPRPSSRDARGAWPEALIAIVCVERTPAVRFWRSDGDTAVELRAAASDACAAALRDHNLRPRNSP
jgi:proteasome lid subunit RPN8/RPN11